MSATRIGLSGSLAAVEDCPTREILGHDGPVRRTVYASVPARVDYELTELGRTLLVPLGAFADWADAQRGDTQTAREKHDHHVERAAQPTAGKERRMARRRTNWRWLIVPVLGVFIVVNGAITGSGGQVAAGAILLVLSAFGPWIRRRLVNPGREFVDPSMGDRAEPGIDGGDGGGGADGGDGGDGGN